MTLLSVLESLLLQLKCELRLYALSVIKTYPIHFVLCDRHSKKNRFSCFVLLKVWSNLG